jgi:gluconokinase
MPPIASAARNRHNIFRIGDRADVRLIYLEGAHDLIARRLAARSGHFMLAALLDSQFAALEPPEPDENAIVVSVDQPVTAIVEAIVIALSLRRANVPALA